MISLLIFSIERQWEHCKDIAYAVKVVNRYANNPGSSHITAVKRIFCYLIHSKDISIVYHGNNELVGYSDSDCAGDYILGKIIQAIYF